MHKLSPAFANLVRKLGLLLTPPNPARVARLVLHLPLSVFAMLALSVAGWRRKRPVTVIVLMNQLGDIIAAEPAARLAAQRAGGSVHWLVCRPYVAVARSLPYVSGVIPVLCASEWILMRWLYDHLPFVEQRIFHIDQHPCHWFGLRIRNPTRFDIDMTTYYLQGGLLSAFSRQGLGIELDERPRLPALRAELERHLAGDPELARFMGRSFAVVHLSSNEAERSASREQAECVAEWLHARGYRIMEVGTAPLLTAGGEVLHLPPELPLPLQFAVIARSRAFVGVDSAFAHAANAFEIPSAILIGRYAHYVTHIPYSGPWRRQIGCQLIRTDRQVKALLPDAIRCGLLQAIPDIARSSFS